MRHHSLPVRATAAAIVLVIAVSAVGCSRKPVGHGSVAHSLDLSQPPAIPDYVTYAAGVELEGVTSVGMTTSFAEDPDWLMIEGDGALTVDMTDRGCSLLLERGSSGDL